MEYTEIEDGVYRGSDGNLYHDERVLRYRVLYQHADRPHSENWMLYSSHSKFESAQAQVERQNKKWEGLNVYKLRDAGEATTIKRLIY